MQYQRLHPQPVACHHEPPLGQIDQYKGIHAVDHRQRRGRPFQGQQAQQNLGVGAAGEGFARLFQRAAQFAVIVDLAVEGQHVASIGAHHRLMPRLRQIEDGKPPKAKHPSGARCDAFVVGAPVLQGS